MGKPIELTAIPWPIVAQSRFVDQAIVVAGDYPEILEQANDLFDKLLMDVNGYTAAAIVVATFFLISSMYATYVRTLPTDHPERQIVEKIVKQMEVDWQDERRKMH